MHLTVRDRMTEIKGFNIFKSQTGGLSLVWVLCLNDVQIVHIQYTYIYNYTYILNMKSLNILPPKGRRSTGVLEKTEE